MIDFFQRIVNARGLPPLPDDDPSIERRYPKFPFVEHPGIRKMQRKCCMRAEHMHDHPELYTHIARSEARQMHLAEAAKPRVVTGSSAANADESYNFTGIETTAPGYVRH